MEIIKLRKFAIHPYHPLMHAEYTLFAVYILFSKLSNQAQFNWGSNFITKQLSNDSSNMEHSRKWSVSSDQLFRYRCGTNMSNESAGRENYEITFPFFLRTIQCAVVHFFKIKNRNGASNTPYFHDRISSHHLAPNTK